MRFSLNFIQTVVMEKITFTYNCTLYFRYMIASITKVQSFLNSAITGASIVVNFEREYRPLPLILKSLIFLHARPYFREKNMKKLNF